MAHFPDVVDVRASYLRFPGWTQHFWTWVTGKALPHQKPLLRHRWWSYLGVTLLVFFAGLGLSSCALALRFDWWVPTLLAGWVLTLLGARTMILVIAHQCIHRRFSGSAVIDSFAGELVTLLNVYQDAYEFKVEHFDAHHRSEVFATLDDPPVQVLWRLGFRPGMTRRQLWIQAILVFLSPAFYWSGFVDRLKCNLTSGTWRRAAFFVWAGLWLSIPFWVPHGTAVLLLAFVLPVILLSQLSALLDKLGEHAWLTPPDPAHGKRYYTVAATWARFCGAPVPARAAHWTAGIWPWCAWSASMLLYHVPSRLMVVVGDLPSHDHHHRFPATPDWMVAAYARQRDIDENGSSVPAYREVWGMGHAIDQMFVTLSSMPEEGECRAGLAR